MNHGISDEDKTLFRNSQKQTRRLKPDDKVIFYKPKTLAKNFTKPAPDISSPSNYSVDVAKVNGTTPISFQRSGIQPRTLRQLRQGKLAGQLHQLAAGVRDYRRPRSGLCGAPAGRLLC